MSVVKETLSSAKIIARDIIPLVYRMAIKPPKPDDIDNLPGRLARTAANHPSKTAIIFEGRSVTWGEVNEHASQIAQALKDRGIGFGDTVSMMMDNRIGVYRKHVWHHACGCRRISHQHQLKGCTADSLRDNHQC